MNNDEKLNNKLIEDNNKLIEDIFDDIFDDGALNEMVLNTTEEYWHFVQKKIRHYNNRYNDNDAPNAIPRALNFRIQAGCQIGIVSRLLNQVIFSLVSLHCQPIDPLNAEAALEANEVVEKIILSGIHELLIKNLDDKIKIVLHNALKHALVNAEGTKKK